MTVMPASGEVADKAVSTEDAASNVEVARLEAVLAALVETKVESMKAAASTTATRRAGSAPASPRRPRLTSSSTASSSQNHHHHHHHHHHHGHHNHHHHHHSNKHDKKRRDDRRHRRHDSAPCGELIEDLVSPHSGHHRSRNGGKGHRRDSEQPIKSPRKKRRHSRSPQGPHQVLPNLIEGPGPDPGLTLLSIDGDNHHHHHHHLDLLNFERARDAFADSHEFPRLQQSSCCFSQSATQLKIHYDVDDYVALNIEEDLDDEEESRKKVLRSPCDRYHRPKRKRKRRRRRIGPEGAPEELVDPEELPPRARWTIVATACLLLAMSLLLVGVTLRMAPIIDDMGDGRRASVSRKGRPRRASTMRRKGSIRPGNASAAAGYIDRNNDRSTKDVPELPTMNLVEIAQDRSRKKIVMIVLAIFIFLLVASILVVVITLTHSSFHSLPNSGSSSPKESTEHQHKEQLRRENEELLNSLSRDSFVPDNVTSTIST